MYIKNINDFLSKVGEAGGFARQNRYEVYIPCRLLSTKSSDIHVKQESYVNTQGITFDWINDYYGVDLAQTEMRLSAFCDKAQLPSYQFQLETVRHYGPQFKIPHMPEYQDITLTFMCGADMFERYFFDAWMYMVMDPITNDFNFKDEYALDIDIVQYYDQATTETAVGQQGSSYSLAGTSANSFNNIFRVVKGNNFSPAQSGRLSTTEFTIDANYWTTLVDAFPVAINEQPLGYDTNTSLQKVSVTFSYKYAVPFNGKNSTTGKGRAGKRAKFQDTIQIGSSSR